MKKTRTWRQLNKGQRDRIQLMWEAGEKQKNIARILEVSPSRISAPPRVSKKRSSNSTSTHPPTGGPKNSRQAMVEDFLYS